MKTPIHHHISSPIGMGNTGSLADLKRCLAWYKSHPKLQRKGRVASLTREIEEKETASK